MTIGRKLTLTVLIAGLLAGVAALGDTVAYRFTVTQNDDPTPDAHTSVQSSGSRDFTWEARNT